MHMWEERLIIDECLEEFKVKDISFFIPIKEQLHESPFQVENSMDFNYVWEIKAVHWTFK